MKKGLIMMMLCLIFVFVSACTTNTNSENASSGNTKDAEGKTKVVFWNLFGGGDGAVMTDVVKQFNEAQQDIEVEAITQEWGEFYTKLTTSVLGNKAPDLAISHATNVLLLKTVGVIQPLDDEARHVGIDFSKFTGESPEITTIDGDHYAVPMDHHAMLLFWNKSLAEQFGVLDDNGQPNFSNYDEFVQIMLKIKEQGGDIAPLDVRGKGTHPFRFWYSIYKQMGGEDLYDNTTNKATIDPEIGVKSLKAVYDLFQTHKVIPEGIDKNNAEIFINGQAVFFISGTWDVNNLYKGMDDNVSVMKFPQLFENPGIYADSHTFVLPVNPNRDDKTTEAAMTFVKWVTDNGWKWSEAGHLPTLEQVMQSEELREQPLREDYKDVVNDMVFLKPNPKVWFASYNQLMDIFDGVWINKFSPEEAVKKIEQVINTALE